MFFFYVMMKVHFHLYEIKLFLTLFEIFLIFGINNNYSYTICNNLFGTTGLVPQTCGTAVGIPIPVPHLWYRNRYRLVPLEKNLYRIIGTDLPVPLKIVVPFGTVVPESVPVSHPWIFYVFSHDFLCFLTWYTLCCVTHI
jgi:hypothetical protein